jgi:DNA-nicking Smr family endonuclease
MKILPYNAQSQQLKAISFIQKQQKQTMDTLASLFFNIDDIDQQDTTASSSEDQSIQCLMLQNRAQSIQDQLELLTTQSNKAHKIMQSLLLYCNTLS